jgi:hypothetical protein
MTAAKITQRRSRLSAVEYESGQKNSRSFADQRAIILFFRDAFRKRKSHNSNRSGCASITKSLEIRRIYQRDHPPASKMQVNRMDNANRVPPTVPVRGGISSRAALPIGPYGPCSTVWYLNHADLLI